MKTLRIAWFTALAVCFAMFIFYSVALPLFHEQTEAAWQWLLPNILPPLGLVFGVEFGNRQELRDADVVQGRAGATSGASGYAMAFSLLFLAALAVSVIGVTIASDPIGFLSMTNFWLSPLLAIAMAALGAKVARGQA